MFLFCVSVLSRYCHVFFFGAVLRSSFDLQTEERTTANSHPKLEYLVDCVLFLRSMLPFAHGDL